MNGERYLLDSVILINHLNAAVAQHHGLLLVTRNTKDFPPARCAFVRIPCKV